MTRLAEGATRLAPIGQRELLPSLGKVLLASPLFVLAPLYRPWHLRWGATDVEVAAAMPGDEIVARPSFSATRAITIASPPTDVWPWLVQLGYGRAGWYSYDLFDNGARPSASRILPEFQHLRVGDWVPMASVVNDTTAFKVTELDANRVMLWEKPNSSWAWTLMPLAAGRKTRLIARLRTNYYWRGSPASALLTAILFEFGDFPMMRKLFLNVKRRAERRATETTPARSAQHGDRRTLDARGRAVIENAVEIALSPEEVFDYCTDLTREPEWNPKAKRVERLTAGPIGLGTRYEAEFLTGDPMTIELVRFERPTVWDATGRSPRLDAKTEGRVSPTDDGARLVIRMELKPKGTLRLLLPVVARYMHRQEERNLAAIKSGLENRPSI